MIRKLIKSWFSKGDDEYNLELPKDEQAKFILSVDNIKVGTLSCQDGEWYFQYANEFKKKADSYKKIVGFSDLDKTYKSSELWPFFRIRIPGLKQPAIQKIIQNENIDKENDVQLLKRFGKHTISNPYELEEA
jgi:HipA-like protein